MAFNFKIEGLEQLQKKFDKLPDHIRDNINREIKANAEDIRRDQSSRAPVHDNELVRSLTVEPPQTDKIEWRIYTKLQYAKFMEFGTGRKSRVEPGFEEQAVYVKGSGGTFEEMVDNIHEWLKKKGITATEIRYTKDGKVKKAGSLAQGIAERNLAWLIATRILQNGLTPRPFFFEPFLTRRDKIIADVKEAIKDL